MINPGPQYNSARVSKLKPSKNLAEARNHQRSEPPKAITLTHKTINVNQILEAHNDNSRKASSVSKISLLANKLDKIKMYN